MTREEARLILYDMFNSCIDGYTNLLAEDKEVPAMLIDDINALDMAIEALSTEKPKGRWIRNSNDYLECSECGFVRRHIMINVELKHCPECTADMRGEEE